jgi:hypothetical protein
MKANGYAVAICMLLVQLAVARDNFVANPGFDALYDSINGGMHPIYWTRLYGNDSQIKVSSSVKKEGYRALLLEDTGSGSVGAASDYIDVTPGFNYTLTAEVKCEDTPSKGCL